MPTNVDIPPLGESVSEAVLVKWLKADGDYVNTADPLAELETDKANVDLPAPTAGIFRRSATEGATVKIGQTVAKIEEGARPAKSAACAATKSAARNRKQFVQLNRPRLRSSLPRLAGLSPKTSSMLRRFREPDPVVASPKKTR